MHPVILMIVFLVHGHPIGAQLVGSTDTAPQCQQLAAQVIEASKAPEGSVPYPVCVDMTNAPDTQAAPAAPVHKGPSTKL